MGRENFQKTLLDVDEGCGHRSKLGFGDARVPTNPSVIERYKEEDPHGVR